MKMRNMGRQRGLMIFWGWNGIVCGYVNGMLAATLTSVDTRARNRRPKVHIFSHLFFFRAHPANKTASTNVYLRIRYVSHRPVPQKYDNKGAITQHTDDKDDGK